MRLGSVKVAVGKADTTNETLSLSEYMYCTRCCVSSLWQPEIIGKITCGLSGNLIDQLYKGHEKRPRAGNA